MRYIIINLDLLGEVIFTDDRAHACADADAGQSVVVDLELRRRYFLGEWRPCEVRARAGLPRFLGRAMLQRVRDCAGEEGRAASDGVQQRAWALLAAAADNVDALIGRQEADRDFFVEDAEWEEQTDAGG